MLLECTSSESEILKHTTLSDTAETSQIWYTDWGKHDTVGLLASQHVMLSVSFLV